MKKTSKTLKNFIAVILIFLFISGLFAIFGETGEKKEKISFSQFATDLQKNKIENVVVKGSEVSIRYNGGEEKVSEKQTGASIFEDLSSYGVSKEAIQSASFDIKSQDGGVIGWLAPLLMFVFPLLIFGWFFWFMYRQAKQGAGQTFNFLKSPAKSFEKKKTKEKIYFKDIADLKEAKSEIMEVVEFLKSPAKFLKMGAQIPRGVLLVGPPGVGKTMLARAVANEADVPFFSMAGSEFIELFVGVGASRTRNLFETAKKNQPSIVFIDELDAIGKARSPGFGGGHEEREQTLNQILSEMDGFDRETGVIILAATNKPEQLDPALLRPGRFDRRIVLDLPDVEGRESILKIHTTKKPLAKSVGLREVAERTPGFSGADLANLANEAAILTAKRDKTQISQEELLESIEKVLLGPERKSHLLSEKEKKISAFHESGHALVSFSLPEAEEVRKVSIVSRGAAAGYTLSLPKQERRIKTKKEFLAELSVLLGGYAAEKITFREISTGAANDLERASKIARQLVTKFGMSDLGPVSLGRRETIPYLGVEEETERNYSEKLAARIDKETERFIKEAEKRTESILRSKKETLKKLATKLMEKETIEKQEFEQIVKQKKTSNQRKRKSGQRKKRV